MDDKKDAEHGDAAYGDPEQGEAGRAGAQQKDGNEPRYGTVCPGCGKIAEAEPATVTWVCSVEGGERRYFCESCARNHIRAIEGRLDSPWW